MSRQTPPPVVDTNPPTRAPRRSPDEPTTTTPPNAPAVTTPVVTSVGTNVGTAVPSVAAGPPAALSMADLMHGRVDPDDDRSQSGVRLPRYLIDAVRLVSATSRGKLPMQDIVTNAVKAYLPPEIVRQAWLQHGGVDEQQ